MAKSKDELIYDIENELVDPTTNKITGERVKARLLDMVNAMGEGGGGAAMEYWACPTAGVGNEIDALAYIAAYTKTSVPAGTFIIGGFGISLVDQGASFIALAFSPNATIAMGDIVATTAELLASEGIDLENLGYTRITKEEFYSLETATE